MLYTPFSHSPPLRVSVPFSPLLWVLQHQVPCRLASLLSSDSSCSRMRCFLVSVNLAARYILRSFTTFLHPCSLPRCSLPGSQWSLPFLGLHFGCLLFSSSDWGPLLLGRKLGRVQCCTSGHMAALAAILAGLEHRGRARESPTSGVGSLLVWWEEGKVVRGWHFGEISDWTGAFR